MKTPGAGFDVQTVNMDFHYSDLSHQRIPSAYERLIYDSIKGDATLFARTEEVIEAWKFLSPVIECWENDKDMPLHGYPAGTGDRKMQTTLWKVMDDMALSMQKPF